MEKTSTSIRLSPEAKRLLSELSKIYAISKTACLELSIREYADNHGVGVNWGAPRKAKP